MVNEHTVDYQPSPSELTSRIHPFIFLKAHKGFISPEYFSQKSFKFMVLRLLANAFMSQKLNLFIHTHAPSKPLPQAEENYLFLQNSGFWKSIFSSRKGGLWSWPGKWPKLNLQGYWSQVLINSTIFATFIFLVFVLL